eukprot:3632995-Lingulodinium_polyedra.AAC.1
MDVCRISADFLLMRQRILERGFWSQAPSAPRACASRSQHRGGGAQRAFMSSFLQNKSVGSAADRARVFREGAREFA